MWQRRRSAHGRNRCRGVVREWLVDRARDAEESLSVGKLLQSRALQTLCQPFGRGSGRRRNSLSQLQPRNIHAWMLKRLLLLRLLRLQWPMRLMKRLISIGG